MLSNSPDYICICDSWDGLHWHMPLCCAHAVNAKIKDVVRRPMLHRYSCPSKQRSSLSLTPRTLPGLFSTEVSVTDFQKEKQTKNGVIFLFFFFLFFHENYYYPSLWKALWWSPLYHTFYLHRVKNHLQNPAFRKHYSGCKTQIYHSLYSPGASMMSESHFPLF